MYRTLISLIKFKLLFVFAAIVSGIAFLISLSNSLLLMYRHKFLCINFVSCNFTELLFLMGFCVCVCVASLWKSPFLDFLYIVSCYLRAVTVLFSVWLLWLGLQVPCWVKVSRMGIFFLFLILEKCFQSFPVEYDVSYIFITYDLYIFRCIPSIPTMLIAFFNNKWMLNFVKSLFFIYWDDHEFYSSIS